MTLCFCASLFGCLCGMFSLFCKCTRSWNVFRNVLWQIHFPHFKVTNVTIMNSFAVFACLYLQECEMPACSAQSTPRPDNFAPLLTQWRYGSWTAVRKQTGFVVSYPIRGHYSLEVYLIESEEYTKPMRFFCDSKQILVLLHSSFCVCVAWGKMISCALESDLLVSLTKNKKWVCVLCDW